MSCNRQVIKQGTTVPVVMTIAGDYAEYAPVLSFRTASGVLDKRGDEVSVEYDAESDTTTIGTVLTQEDTLGFSGVLLEIDMRAPGPDGDVIGALGKPVLGIEESINKEVLGE